MTLPHNRTDRLFGDWCSRQSSGLLQILHILAGWLVGFVGCQLLTSTPSWELWALRKLLRKCATCGL
jgi:hypothetical protein